MFDVRFENMAMMGPCPEHHFMFESLRDFGAPTVLGTCADPT